MAANSALKESEANVQVAGHCGDDVQLQVTETRKPAAAGKARRHMRSFYLGVVV